MRDSNYDEGAYYYTHLVFMWGAEAIYNDPSMYAIIEYKYIWFPYLDEFLTKDNCKSMYFPFYENDRRVSLKNENKI